MMSHKTFNPFRLFNPLIKITQLGSRLYSRMKGKKLQLPDVIEFTIPSGFVSINSNIQFFTSNGKDQIAAHIHLNGWNSFEKPFPEHLLKLSQNSEIIFDVGANTGFYTLLAGNCRNSKHVYAFEPFPEVNRFLRKNVLHNRLNSKVTVIDSALGDTSETKELYIPTEPHQMVETSSSLNKNFSRFNENFLDSIQVQVDTIDNIMKSKNIHTLNLLKIDVETYEHKVIEGGMTSITEFRPWILLEILPESDFSIFNKFLQSHHYLCLPVVEKLSAQAEITRKMLDLSSNFLFCPNERKERTLDILISGY